MPRDEPQADSAKETHNVSIRTDDHVMQPTRRRRSRQEGRMQISRILFPTDFSHDAEHAFQYALTLARAFGAELYLLHVIYFPPQTPEYDIGQVIDSLVKNAEGSLKKLADGINEPKPVIRMDVQVGVEHAEITKFRSEEHTS